MRLERGAPAVVVDESSRADHPVEWWFVQGRFEGEGCEVREFMVSLFRHALQWAGLSAGSTCTLIGSILDPSVRRATCWSQVDPATTPFLVKAARYAPPTGLDPLAIRVVAEELSEYGPPRPIRVESRRPLFESALFGVSWGDFALMQAAQGFELRFVDPESGRRCHFALTPRHPRVHLSEVELPDGGAMDYASYTRLALTGEVGGEPVRGQAWFDHQWGSQGWLIGGKRRDRMLGWDWLGIQLDDGRDVLMMAHRDRSSGAALCQYAVVVDEDGAARLHRQIVLTPTAWWTSAMTGARYPVTWRLAIPELELELDFEPLALDQEIPMLAPNRAVWEGAGRVAGTSGRRTVAGRARLELHGYAYVLDLRRHVDAISQRIQQHIEAFLPRSLRPKDLERFTGMAGGPHDTEAQTAVLSQPLWDLMDRSGKRWWAVFATLMTAALGTNPEPYEPLISVTAEMLHDGALVIDDIQDHGRVRRGEECIHLRYGIDVAINAGNTAYFLPMAMLADYPGLRDVQRLELYRVLTRLYIRTHVGQAQDVYWSKFLSVERLRGWMEEGLEPRILQVYSEKTGALTEAAAEGAAVLADASAETRAACARFGQRLGVALQILNDIANFGMGRVARGDGGTDLAEGKLTLPILRALQRLRKHDRERLETIFCSPDLRQDRALLAEGISLVRKSGAIEASQQEACRMLEAEWRQVSAVLPPSEPKSMLRVLWTFLVELADDDRHSEFAPA